MFQRNQRIQELLKQEVSLLVREIKDPGVAGLVTVTDLELAKDRKTAKVFFSVLGSDAQRASTAKAFERAAGFLGHQLRERLELRIIPKLSFHVDNTPERASRIDKLLSRLEDQRREDGT